jgi:hypothetical protein
VRERRQIQHTRQLALVGEVVIEGADADTRIEADILERRPERAVAIEALECRVE